MIFQTSTAVTVYAFFTAARVGKTGLAVKVSVNLNGTTISGLAVSNAIAATEVDSVNQPGVYSYTISALNTATEGAYTLHFYTTDTTVDQQHLEALIYCYAWIGNMLAKVNLITSATTVTLISPVLVKDITTVRGDDYKFTDGRALFQAMSFTNTPSLVGALSVLLLIQIGNTVFSKAGVIDSGTTLHVDMTSAETISIGYANYPYDLQVTLADGNIVTLMQGQFINGFDVR